MTQTTISRQLLIAAFLALSAAPWWAQAQALPDPTRPPDAVAAPTADGGQPAASGLQTIIRRQGAKPAAVINGEYVELGAKVGDSRLVKVGEDSVVLEGPAGKEELKLFPGVEKKAVVAPQAGAAKKAKAAKGGKRKQRAPQANKDEATK